MVNLLCFFFFDEFCFLKLWLKRKNHLRKEKKRKSWFVAVGTVVGTVVAFMLVPMRSLGPDNWKIASALMGSYIGGSLLKIQRGMLPAVTAITIVLAPSFPDFFNSLAPSAETISLVLMLDMKYVRCSILCKQEKEKN
ncbi:unnamed protein product [Eruca vesicaria subsp. sativa]|uniref:Uncharacterized protein n=1 Tax=Eruca vesicaria subsp. sativa TaxID=29727 RepID=A0ABC8LNZ6_ERUVS|nr:unnamed protein product [Eruca vesicaria subsp. sativa]